LGDGGGELGLEGGVCEEALDVAPSDAKELGDMSDAEGGLPVGMCGLPGTGSSIP
jgi:hypothetical protein